MFWIKGFSKLTFLYVKGAVQMPEAAKGAAAFHRAEDAERELRRLTCLLFLKENYDVEKT